MKIIKYSLLIIIILLFCLQAVQQSLHVFPGLPLQGVANSSKAPLFTQSAYQNNDYQLQFEKFIEENMGFRSLFIRLKNQCDYSLFNYTGTPQVVIGKKGMLFMEPYILNYKGSVFKGADKISNNVRRLKMIQDELRKHNVGFLLIFAPGKASFYPEFIPDNYQQRSATNYGYYTKAITGSGINFIDMNSWFLKMKGKTKYPLYPLNGSHWNSYGICLAADSILHYIPGIKNIDPPSLRWDLLTISDSMRLKDNDIGELLNLWKPVKSFPMPYFRLSYNSEGKIKPKVITIGDSYWLGFTETGIIKNVFANDRFWYYFKKDVINGDDAGIIKYTDIKSELYSQDLVILISTESNFQEFPFGFIESFFEQCMPSSQEASMVKLEQYIELIKSTPKWYQYIIKKAKMSGISIEEQLKRDAQFSIGQEQKNNP